MANEGTELLVRLFTQEVPEIASGVVEIMASARKAGFRCKLAVQSRDSRVDAVGACVGKRGSRICKIVDQLGNERIDIFLWHDSPEVLITRALQPAVIEKVILHHAQHRADVVVKEEEQMSLVEGRGGVNRELASQLSGWAIQVMTQ
jgi:N utilization substance protein A